MKSKSIITNKPIIYNSKLFQIINSPLIKCFFVQYLLDKTFFVKRRGERYTGTELNFLLDIDYDVDNFCVFREDLPANSSIEEIEANRFAGESFPVVSDYFVSCEHIALNIEHEKKILTEYDDNIFIKEVDRVLYWLNFYKINYFV